MKKSFLAAIAICIAASILLTAGCNNKQKQESATLMEQNQQLTERVSELEYLLSQAHAQEQSQMAAAPQQAAPSQAAPSQAGSVYTVVQGDTLWRIAQRQLGSGSRYKEILALNPQIAENRPLSVGTKLNLPAR